MSTLDYRGLAALDAVIGQGSFERAASALSISQPAISHRLRTLEEATGELLVIREQPPRATAHGHRLIAHYRQVLLLEAGLRTEASAATNLPDLAIAVNADSAATWLLSALEQVLQAPFCQIEILLDDQDQTLRLLREGRVVGCVSSSQEAVAGTTMESLGGMSYRCVATPAFVQRWCANGVDAAAVRRAPALIYDRNDRLHRRFLHQCGLPDEGPRNFFPSSQGFIAFIEAGHGYGMAPWIQVRDALDGGRLVELIPGAALQVPLYWHHWKIKTPLTRLLNSALLETAHQWLDLPAA